MATSGFVIQGYFPHAIAPGASRTMQPKAATQAGLPPHAMNYAVARGVPLPAAVLQKMEAVFGASFSDVRIHVGPHVAAIGAVAFTHGSHIHFAPNQYHPETSHGQQLLGRELTHVVQQRAGRVRSPGSDGLAVVRDAALEAEAERMAIRAATMPPPRPPIQRTAVQASGSRFAPVRQTGVTRPPIAPPRRPLNPATATIQRLLSATDLTALVDLVDAMTVKGLRFDSNHVDDMEHNTATIAPYFYARDVLVTKDHLHELRQEIRDRIGIPIYFAAPGGRYVKPVVRVERAPAKPVLAGMKRSAFKAALLKMGCIATGLDGQNHDKIMNPDNKQTTALGIGGHGDPNQTTGHLRTYLNQLGIDEAVFLASL